MPERKAPLPADVETLLDEKLESIAQLEILLLLHGTAPRAWAADEIAAELRIEEPWAAEQLATLQGRGLIVPDRDSSERYRFESSSPAQQKAVESLAACYVDRRVTVVGRLYSKPAHSLRALSDAFKIRGEGSDG